ncbi:MAG: glycogen synthase GlgA [Deltaproteobacteria bacterium]|nr:glycogen synthase GlgA [Deltaproteobacteria bacterium]
MLKVLFVTSEAEPFAKTGGLADVSGSLPKALRNEGCDVRILLPFYRTVREQGLNYELLGEDVEVTLGDRRITGDIRGLLVWENDFPVYFVQKDEFYDREFLYGIPKGDYFDNAERFIFLSKMVLPLCEKVGFAPDIIHCHDWQTGLIPVYVKTVFRNSAFFSETATVLSIHNIAYQGIFDKGLFAQTGLAPALFSPSALEYWGGINFLKAGLVFADIITTVSKKYSQEIQTPDYGYGLDGVVRDRSRDLYGVLNGADYEEWNPATDNVIASRYTSDDLSGKVKCKQDVLRAFKLSRKMNMELPLVGIISRLVDQKGFDLVVEVMDELMKLNCSLVLLGIGDRRYNELFATVAKKYPKRIGLKLGYDRVLAHKIEAGCDMFLMPSRYEPCGLNQIYSLKYGTIPIVRATGGLDDTVQDFDLLSGEGNGFKFNAYTGTELLAAIKKAIKTYNEKERWRQLMKNAMAADFSWERSAKRYVELYHRAISKTRPAG